MEKQSLTLGVEGGMLTVVPAIHNNHVFAGEVYRLCADPATSPLAVAVELGPSRAQAVRQWMLELGVGSPAHRHIPVMLGLLSRNRMIRASLKEKALELQRSTGLDLSEMGPGTLKKELGYSGYGLVLLSPTDSIIEAIRCAVELNLQVFGVDLEEIPGCAHQPGILQDPFGGISDLMTYVMRNARWRTRAASGKSTGAGNMSWQRASRGWCGGIGASSSPADSVTGCVLRGFCAIFRLNRRFLRRLSARRSGLSSE